MKRKVLISVLVVALVLVLCIGVFAACDKDNVTPKTQYTVTFSLGDYDGATAAPADQKLDAGSKLTLPACPATWTGHTFSGWTADGGTTLYQPNDELTVEADLNFVAKWEQEAPPAPTTYTISYDLNGASGTAPASVTKNEGETLNLPTAADLPAYPDHTFQGWKLNNEGDLLAGGATITVSANAKYYAQWKLEYTVTFSLGADYDGDQQAPTAIKAEPNQQIDLPTLTFKWNNKESKKWTEDPTGTEFLDAGAKYTVTKSVTLYAFWTYPTYQVTVYGLDKAKLGDMTATTLDGDEYNIIDPAQEYDSLKAEFGYLLGYKLYDPSTQTASDAFDFNSFTATKDFSIIATQEAVGEEFTEDAFDANFIGLYSAQSMMTGALMSAEITETKISLSLPKGFFDNLNINVDLEADITLWKNGSSLIVYASETFEEETFYTYYSLSVNRMQTKLTITNLADETETYELTKYTYKDYTGNFIHTYNLGEKGDKDVTFTKFAVGSDGLHFKVTYKLDGKTTEAIIAGADEYLSWYNDPETHKDKETGDLLPFEPAIFLYEFYLNTEVGQITLDLAGFETNELILVDSDTAEKLESKADEFSSRNSFKASDFFTYKDYTGSFTRTYNLGDLGDTDVTFTKIAVGSDGKHIRVYYTIDGKEGSAAAANADEYLSWYNDPKTHKDKETDELLPFEPATFMYEFGIDTGYGFITLDIAGFETNYLILIDGESAETLTGKNGENCFKASDFFTYKEYEGNFTGTFDLGNLGDTDVTFTAVWIGDDGKHVKVFYSINGTEYSYVEEHALECLDWYNTDCDAPEGTAIFTYEVQVLTEFGGITLNVTGFENPSLIFVDDNGEALEAKSGKNLFTAEDYEAPIWTVTLKAAGKQYTAQVKDGELLTIPDEVPREYDAHPSYGGMYNKTLNYWTDDKGDKFDLTTPITGDITLSANYTPCITFDLNGATGTIDPILIATTQGDAYLPAVDPSADDDDGITYDKHRFIGWKSTDESDTKLYQSGDRIYAYGNLKFIAQWREIKDEYTVTFYNESEELSSTTVKNGAYATSPQDVLTFNKDKSKYFWGWGLKGESTKFDFENTPIIDDTEFEAIYHIYVAYDGNGADSGEAPKLILAETGSVGVPAFPDAGTLVKAGFKLAGWYLASTPEKVYAIGSEYGTGNHSTSASLTFLAKWVTEDLKVNVKFEASHATGTMEGAQYEPYIEIELPEPTFTHEAGYYYFLGWQYQDGEKTKTLQPKAKYTLAEEDITFTAAYSSELYGEKSSSMNLNVLKLDFANNTGKFGTYDLTFTLGEEKNEDGYQDLTLTIDFKDTDKQHVATAKGTVNIEGKEINIVIYYDYAACEYGSSKANSEITDPLLGHYTGEQGELTFAFLDGSVYTNGNSSKASYFQIGDKQYIAHCVSGTTHYYLTIEKQEDGSLNITLQDDENNSGKYTLGGGTEIKAKTYTQAKKNFQLTISADWNFKLVNGETTFEGTYFELYKDTYYATSGEDWFIFEVKSNGDIYCSSASIFAYQYETFAAPIELNEGEVTYVGDASWKTSGFFGHSYSITKVSIDPTKEVTTCVVEYTVDGTTTYARITIQKSTYASSFDGENEGHEISYYYQYNGSISFVIAIYDDGTLMIGNSNDEYIATLEEESSSGPSETPTPSESTSFTGEAYVFGSTGTYTVTGIEIDTTQETTTCNITYAYNSGTPETKEFTLNKLDKESYGGEDKTKVLYFYEIGSGAFDSCTIAVLNDGTIDFRDSDGYSENIFTKSAETPEEPALPTYKDVMGAYSKDGKQLIEINLKSDGTCTYYSSTINETGTYTISEDEDGNIIITISGFESAASSNGDYIFEAESANGKQLTRKSDNALFY